MNTKLNAEELTVEEVEEVAWEWAIASRMVGKATGPISLSYDLRARIAAAIEAKTNSK